MITFESNKLFPETVWVNPLLQNPSLMILLGGIVIEQELLFDMFINWFGIFDSTQLEGGCWWEIGFVELVGLKTGAGRAGWGCNIANDEDMADVDDADGPPCSNWLLLCRFTLLVCLKEKIK